MTFFEAENFYKQDKKKYIIKYNMDILKFITLKKQEGINFVLNVEQIQQMMNDIVQFFEFKYPNSFISDLIYKSENREREIQICQKLSKALDIDQLKYRLCHDYVQFLDCPYGQHLYIQREKKNLWDWTNISIRIDDNGFINDIDLQNLEEQQFIHNIDGVKRISDLLGKFIESPINVNYSELSKAVINHKAYIQLRNMILELIPLQLIYSRSTLPEYGYIRAKSFVRMFNKEYKLNISMEEVNEIMHQDYSIKKVKTK